MAEEIERKFKLCSDSWKQQVSGSKKIRQGYLQSGLKPEQASSVRVRIANDKATLNIKSAEMSVRRTEYEYEIPVDEAEHMLSTLCEQPIIEKTRYLVPHGEHLWEIDIFEGENSGLEIAEVEVNSTDETVKLPDWVGEEVSDDSRYYNIYLLKQPFKYWKR